jgi:hypothetical protein
MAIAARLQTYAAGYPGRIIARHGHVVEVEPAELLRVQPWRDDVVDDPYWRNRPARWLCLLYERASKALVWTPSA